MKAFAHACLLASVVAVSLTYGSEGAYYFSSADSDAWRLWLSDSTYRLRTESLGGALCEEIGRVERVDAKIRFATDSKCPLGIVLRDKLFVVVVRNGREFLVADDEVTSFESWIAREASFPQAHPYFERVSKETKH